MPDKRKALSAGQRGFTLIELMVVVMILGILAALLLPRLTSLQRDARIAKLQAARGSVTAAATLVHATALTRGGLADTNDCIDTGIKASNNTGGAGTVCTESGIVHTAYAYPQVTALGGKAGILAAAGLTGVFNPSRLQLEAEGYAYAAVGNLATFGVQDARDAAHCFFTYTQPSVPTAAAIISGLTISGC